MAELTLLAFQQRKAVLVLWDKNEIKGQSVSIQAAHGTDDFAEKRAVPNHGGATVTYGQHFTGESHIRVEGTKGGAAEGTVHVA